MATLGFILTLLLLLAAVLRLIVFIITYRTPRKNLDQRTLTT
jgi:hypothetical protein